MPAAHIRVIATPNGGGFGGKSDPFNHEIVVCKLSLLHGPARQSHASRARKSSTATAAATPS